MNTNLLKFIAVPLTAVLLMGLVACSKDKGEAPPEGSPPPSGESAELAGWENPLKGPRPASDFRPSPQNPAQALAAAKALNADVVGFLEVPGTELFEPVVQTTDNEYYYRRNTKKEYAFDGSIWMDYESTIGDGTAGGMSQNTLLYGHNIGNPQGVRDDKNGSKFAQLFWFDDIEFARAHPYFYFTTEKGSQIYEIFTVFYSEDKLTPVPYHMASYSKGDYESLISDVRSRSQFHYNVDMGPDDKIMTLSTCSYKYGTYTQNPKQRFVLMGRLVGENESLYESAQLEQNPAPKVPNF